MALPIVTTVKTGTGLEQTHTFSASMRRVRIHAVDGTAVLYNATGGSAAGFTLASGQYIDILDPNWAGQTLYFTMTAEKLLSIMELTGLGC